MRDMWSINYAATGRIWEKIIIRVPVDLESRKGTEPRVTLILFNAWWLNISSL